MESRVQWGANDGSQSRGEWAEQVAASYLEKKGFVVLERNFQTRLGEVDLIAQKGVLLAFVEVRYRRSAAFGAPEETVTKAKRRKVILAAYDYTVRRGLTEQRVIRFDVVAVVAAPGGHEILHLEDAFEADLSRLAPPPLM
ncbi:MAG: YraN family protein [Deltaproteobacteria bacterium]|nr:YraN family protein [Deltaproteobacteria bacterium]